MRNFDGHLNNRCLSSCDHSDRLHKETLESNHIYDANVGITHVFVPFFSRKRYVGPVELAFSSDPSVLSVVSPAHQTVLRSSYLSARRSTGSSSVTDEDLLHAPDGNIFPSERSESDSLIRSSVDKLSNAVPSPVDATPPVSFSSDPPSGSVS